MSDLLKTFSEVAGDTGKKLWKEIGEDALKKAVSTFVGEGVKAVVDLWKTRRVKELEREFKARAREEDAAASPAVEEARKPQEGALPETPDVPEVPAEPAPPADPADPAPPLDPEPPADPAPPTDRDTPQKD